jgi:hypothetical protein
MLIKLTHGNPAALDGASDFKSFKVVSAVAQDQAAAALGDAGKFDGEYAWIDAAWLKESGPDDDAWREGLAKMIGYAEKSGWLDPAGAIRAHIEWA